MISTEIYLLKLQNEKGTFYWWFLIKTTPSQGSSHLTCCSPGTKASDPGMITFVQSELGACGILRLSVWATNIINYEVIVWICFEVIWYTYMYRKVLSTFVTNISPRDWCRAYQDKAAIEKAVLVDWCKALNLSSQYRFWSTILSEKSFTISLLICDLLEEEFLNIVIHWWSGEKIPIHRTLQRAKEHWIAKIQSITPAFHQNYLRKLDQEWKKRGRTFQDSWKLLCPDLLPARWKVASVGRPWTCQ